MRTSEPGQASSRNSIDDLSVKGLRRKWRGDLRIRIEEHWIVGARVTTKFFAESLQLVLHSIPGDNHHMEIIAIQKGSRTTYKGVPVTRFEAVRRHTANEPVIQKDHGPGAEFLFSLSQGDMVTWKENFWRVRGVTDDGQGRILLKLAKDARSITKVGKDDLPRPYVNGFISTGGRKIYVSPLGIIREAHD
jgi:hypothetical protein